MGVLLFARVRRTSIKLFESEAEAEWVVVGALGELKVSEKLLHLMEHVVIDAFSFVLD